ncbi:hypothetical protein B0H11DRAFT_820914 [Mycena galericulata]|nr:hypothetical protein B0H11DRAFT_820914 [Mycena galericulata]
MVYLPAELFDAIVGEVHDQPTLRSCALAATSFLSPSQRNIFRSLRLCRKSSAPPGYRSLKDAAALFKASPHLGTYVRDLTIELPDSPPKLAAWNVILRSAQNVERLVVSGRSTFGSGEAASLQTLLDYLALPSLGRLHLMNMRVIPSALILAATSIPVVSFYRVTVIEPPEDPQLQDSTSAARLRHLILTDSGAAVVPTYELLLHPRDPPYTSHIERLEIRLDAYSRGYDQRLLTACAATLKYLVIDPGALVDPINIPHLPLVREVEIKVFVDSVRRLPTLFPSTFGQIASSLPLVESITLTFLVEPLFPEIAWEDAGPFPIVGPSFMNRTELLHLRHVHCKLLRRSVFGDMEELFTRFVAAMEARMPGLLGTGILACTLADPQLTYTARLP